MKTIKKVQVWVFCDEEVLLLKVIEKRGAGWHPVTANVDGRETLEECALREIGEETGIKVQQGYLKPLDYHFEYESDRGHVTEHVFSFEMKQKPRVIKIDSKEHTDHWWGSFQAAQKRVSFQPQREALKVLLQKLSEK